MAIPFCFEYQYRAANPLFQTRLPKSGEYPIKIGNSPAKMRDIPIDKKLLKKQN